MHLCFVWQGWGKCIYVCIQVWRPKNATHDISRPAITPVPEDPIALFWSPQVVHTCVAQTDWQIIQTHKIKIK